MQPTFFAWVVIVAGLAGCGAGGTWVDTDSGACTDAQIAEASKNVAAYGEMGSRWCQGRGDFAGEFRCAGSAENGTRKLQVKCSG